MLTRVISGDLRRVILNMPPRHGKSEFFSKYLPACFLGHHPSKNVILTSYEATYAEQWGMKAQQVFTTCAQECYGLTLGAKSAFSAWTIAEHGGGMQTAGAGGPITGKGADLFLIDDPIKNDRDALSQTQRDHLWDWMISTALSRLEPGGAMCILMTRWHEDDLTARVLQMAKDTGEDWLHISLPALCLDPTDDIEQWLGRKKGDALWPTRYDVPALQLMESRHVRWFNAMYQQQPSHAEGQYMKRSWLRYFVRKDTEAGRFYELRDEEGARLVAHKDLRIFFTMDLAASTKTSADYTVISTWGLEPKTSTLLWLDAVGERLEGPDQEALLIKLYNERAPALIGIESVAYQLTLVQNMARKGLPVFKLKADKDKISRFLPAAAAYKNGKIYHPLTAPWLDTVEKQLLAFPNAPHDDYVDTCAYAQRMLNYMLGAGEVPIEGA